MNKEAIGVSCEWSIYEFRPEGKLLVARAHNVMTNYGLTAFASNGAGGTGYLLPSYLVVETKAGKIQNTGGIGVSATSIQTDIPVHLAGDTSLVLDVGQGSQETVSFSAVSGTGPFTYTISATLHTHPQNALVSRTVTINDTMNSVQGELQYDSVNFPNQRVQTTGGYSSGNANWITSFFFSGTQALGQWVRLGLADSLNLGTGNLHNHLVLGFNQQAGFDAEVDVSITLSNV